MNERDPIHALQSYFEAAGDTPVIELQVADVYRVKSRRSQKALGAVCGFVAGTAVAVTLLLIAARPIPTGARGTEMSAIARYQMINSGLAERHLNRTGVER